MRQLSSSCYSISYAGAPWDVIDNPDNKLLLEAGEFKNGVGNGGFSLRSTKVMLQIVNEFAKNSPIDENEDLFFAKNVEKLGYNIAPRHIAYSFCREQLCKDIEDRSDDVPFALHSAWYYYNERTSSKWLERA